MMVTLFLRDSARLLVGREVRFGSGWREYLTETILQRKPRQPRLRNMFIHRLYDMPQLIAALIIVTPIVALSTVGALVLGHRIPASWSESRDAIGACASAVGVIYAVLLGMIAVAAWDDYTELTEKVTEEASLANNLYRDAEGFPEPTKGALEKLYFEYVELVLCEEWPKLRKGEFDVSDPPTRRTVNEIMQTVSTFKPADLGEANVHRETFDVVNRLLGMRRARLLSLDTELLPVLWFVVLAGGVATIVLSWFLRVSDRLLHVLLNGIYSFVVGLMIFCIFTLDHPFWGEVSVDPKPFQYVGCSLLKFQKTETNPEDCIRKEREAFCDELKSR